MTLHVLWVMLVLSYSVWWCIQYSQIVCKTSYFLINDLVLPIQTLFIAFKMNGVCINFRSISKAQSWFIVLGPIPYILISNFILYYCSLEDEARDKRLGSGGTEYSDDEESRETWKIGYHYCIIGLEKETFHCKIENIFIFVRFNRCCGC